MTFTAWCKELKRITGWVTLARMTQSLRDDFEAGYSPMQVALMYGSPRVKGAKS